VTPGVPCIQVGCCTHQCNVQWLFTEPEPGVFNYTEGEIVSSIAKATNKTLRCHALVWHNQLAPWVANTTWTPETLKAAITRHVSNVAGHWKGQCYAWDVVNEALEEDGTYRQSLFYKTLGTEYIVHAFREAAKADPDAKLYYNDYGIEKPGVKADGAVKLLRMLKDAGVKVDGLGLQSHFHAETHPSVEQLTSTMREYEKLVDEIAVTELDVRIQLPVNATNLEQQSQGYANVSCPTTVSSALLCSNMRSVHKAYDTCGKVATACMEVKKCIGITIWDFCKSRGSTSRYLFHSSHCSSPDDPFSWVPATFPGQGAALLWFDNFTTHPAYRGLIEAFVAKNITRSRRHAAGARAAEYKRSSKLW